MTNTLFGITTSPFTERARWALDHHRQEYRYHEHVPMLGEPLLRLKVRGLGLPKATVPVYESEGKVYPGGLMIARHADEVGKSTPLFRAADDAAIVQWVHLTDQLLDVGRAWVLDHLANSVDAQREALPLFVPSFARGALAPTAGTVARFLQKKHAAALLDRDIDAAVERVARPALEKIRAARGSRAYLLSNFSFADISVCAALGMVRPRKDSLLPPATRDVWTHERLAAEFEDLLDWREEVYGKHRRAS